MNDAADVLTAANLIAKHEEIHLEPGGAKQRYEAARVLARFALSQVKPDDGEIVTEEWVLASGITKDLDVESFLYRFAEEAEAGKKTRRHFRDLCAALGIELHEGAETK